MKAPRTPKTPQLQSHVDPHESARAAHLRYLTDRKPGIHRLRTGPKTFRYTGPDNKPLRDPETLARIKSLVIPPAWNDVWIAPIENAHLQATGRDARGRKQSRYHPRWRATRDETKYERMKMFAAVLPHIRKRVDHDLALHGLPKNKVLACIIRVMETTFIRVGNVEYARENQSYGLTTMRNRHVEIHGGKVHFTFKGKSGVQHSIDLEDKRLARIIARCHDIPGHELFQFLDHEGNHHHVDSADINEYLREITNEHFTAKDFRTWAGTVLACMMLQQLDPYDTGTQAKKNLVSTVAAVAQRLGNTPSVCRKCYIHPAVIEHYLHGTISNGALKAAIAITEENPHAPPPGRAQPPPPPGPPKSPPSSPGAPSSPRALSRLSWGYSLPRAPKARIQSPNEETHMPQSTNVTANQMRNIPEQAAEAAATNHGKETHLSPHEETVQAEEQKHNTDPNAGHNTVHEQALHHGKAAQK